MEIQVADQRILLFPDQLGHDEAQEKAWDKKMSSFDTLSKVTSFFTRASDDDFELTYQEHRYEPFWHVMAKSKYVYDRTTDYQVPASGPEVRSLTLLENDYEVSNGHYHLKVLEHCLTETQEEVLVDGVTGKNAPELSKYLPLSSTVVKDDLKDLIPKKSIIVPPQTRVSALMRDTLAKMIKGIQADKILEENVVVNCIDLYYHPVYAFQYTWTSKNKQAIIEIDGLTGEVRAGTRLFNEYLGYALNRDFLFDLGADAAGMFIPGGSIAVKVAKRYLDTTGKKTKH